MIGLQRDNQEHQESYIMVDEQDLVTQIGGILGITIGWSFVSMLAIIPGLLKTTTNIIQSC